MPPTILLLYCAILPAAVLSQNDPLIPFLTTGSCGVDKQCIRLPNSGCDYDTCDILLTWKSGLLNDQSVIAFEFGGSTTSSSKSPAYIAVAFSTDDRRGNDYILACGWDGAKEFVRYAYQSSDLLTPYQEPSKGYQFVRSPEVYFNPANGRVSCTFAIYRDRTPENPLTKLSTGVALTYFFVSGTDPQLGDYPGLSEDPTNGYGPWYASPSEAPLTSDKWHQRVKKSPKVVHRAHAILMLIAWMWFASIGIVTARYMKTVLGSTRTRTDPSARKSRTTYIDNRVWYQIHRALQIAAVALTVVSFVLIFVGEGKWVGPDFPFLPEAAHPILGIVVMALALINFILGWCAPRPVTRSRCVWNWFHWLIGTASHCIALPTIFIGMMMKNWAWYAPVILFVWVIFHVVVELLLEILNCCAHCLCCFRGSKGEAVATTSSRDDSTKKDANSKESKALVFQSSDGRRILMHEEESVCCCRGTKCRMIIWIIHMVVTSILAIVLCFVLALTG